MKTISINGKELEYEILYDVSEYDEYYSTVFYDGVVMEEYRKYLLFGPKLKREKRKEVFTLYFSIEDPSYTKDEIRSILERKVELLGRKEEIENGELI